MNVLIIIVLITGAISTYFLFKRTVNDSNMEKAFKAKETGQFEHAIQFYSEAINESPKNWIIYYHRALCKKELKDINGAKTDLEEAIKIAPKYSQLAKEELENLTGEKIKFGKQIDELFR